MKHVSSRGLSTGGAAFVLAAVGGIGSTVLATGRAAAAPNLPKGVRVQCSEFRGPNTSFPHFLSGCTRRNGDTGAGQTEKLPPPSGTETLIWYLPFINGRTMQLVNITNSPVNPLSGQCPADHLAEFNVSGSIKYTRWEGSAVTATICVGASDFVLKPNTFFTISKNKNDNSADDPNDEP